MGMCEVGRPAHGQDEGTLFAMLHRALVPVELSATDTRTTAFSRGLARYGVREIVLLHAAELVGMERPVAERQEDELREKLFRLVPDPAEEPPVFVPVLEPGDPDEVVLRVVRERRVDLVVCATRAKSVLNEFALGSVSEALARRSPVPLLLLPYDMLAEQSPEEAFETGSGVFDRVHVPTDFSDVSEHTLDYVKKLGPEAIQSVVLTHCLDRKGLRDEQRPAAERTAVRVLTAIRAELDQRGIDSSAELLHGPVVDALLQLTEDRDCTCIALGSKGHSMGEELLLGSVSLSVLRRTRVPVLLTR